MPDHREPGFHHGTSHRVEWLPIMNNISRTRFVALFLGMILFTGSPVLSATDRVGSESAPPFFFLEHFDFENSLVELYEGKKFVDVKNYPKVRRLLAQKFAVDYKPTIATYWGKPGEPFLEWMEKHPELLEEFLTAIHRRKDDIPSALRIMKQLCTEFPEKVEEYPELAIATAVVWDQPNSEVFSDCRIHYHATEPPNPLGATGNFLYYTDSSAPFNERIRSLPREFLVFIVCNRTSQEERRWIWKNYGQKKKMLGKSYEDPPFVPRWDLKDPEPGERYSDALLDRAYTPTNIRKYGTVCSGRADYALSVCRTLGVPAFQGIGWPKYAGGHYWVQWFEIRDISPKTKRISFTLEQCGRDANRKDRIAHSPSPNLGERENDGIFLHRLSRAGKDLIAYRHGETLMQCFSPLASKMDFTVKQRLELLEQINAICPANLNAYREIAALAKNKQFDKKFVPQVMKIHSRMVDEFLFSPNFLPKLSADLLSFPEIQSEEKKIYQKMFDRLEKADRRDLIFQSAKTYFDSLSKQERYQDAFQMVASLSLRCCEEANEIEPMLGLLDEITNREPELYEKHLVEFYAKFLTKIMQEGKDFPNSYRMDMLKRALPLFEKTNRLRFANRAKVMMEKVDADMKKFDQGLREHVQSLKEQYEASQKN